jgi:hypothetical protein
MLPTALPGQVSHPHTPTIFSKLCPIYISLFRLMACHCELAMSECQCDVRITHTVIELAFYSPKQCVTSGSYGHCYDGNVWGKSGVLG